MAIILDADRIAGQAAVAGNVTYPQRQLAVPDLVVMLTILADDVFIFGSFENKELVENGLDMARAWLNACEIS